MVLVSVKSSELYEETPTRYPLMVLSLDGFRWDYLDRGLTPNLDSLLLGGVRANYTTAQFPTKTFPNHYSIATGLLPEYHGIVSNKMFEPETGKSYNMRINGNDSYWYGGEPIWVTAKKAGLTTACAYFPGCGAAIANMFPDYNLVPYTNVPPKIVTDQLIQWTVDYKPDLTMAYYYSVDAAGHSFGPDSVEVNNAIMELDSSIGEIFNQLKQDHKFQLTNIIVLSDHGMTKMTAPKRILLDTCLTFSQMKIVDMSPIVGIYPVDGKATLDEIYQNLSNCHPNLHAYRKGVNLPQNLFKGDSSYQNRIAPVLGVADLGWLVTTSTEVNFESGDHGYVSTEHDMFSMFLAHGPNIKPQSDKMKPFTNLEYYNFFAKLMHLSPQSLPPTNSTQKLVNLLYKGFDDSSDISSSSLIKLPLTFITIISIILSIYL
ncbi:type I phosphodiesterase/nucleotide pyrophosphatase family protein [Tieghemostelium lacteum]|uniref:Type I phosphodiesterase/nucleotide pyrophosphatase family protein n=1 Tax=Tieghemostelium lacteum TaxID=361077 RepID=A0A151ZI44_TIELA|nr:type I phosphodiesterase/nucleotide pyrophosphatase family protein [Tieghemostelium lacteum]|eukprot:KYQ93587.1 type I phosphodiesterase/nucleotide pyrophosphatase family protein [Tieghemostelium lacteum]